jgi:ABC-type transport system involved in multi-copper enzyme maturation permease subunit
VADWAIVAGFQFREVLQRRLVWLLLPASALPVALFAFILRVEATDPATPPSMQGEVLQQLLTMMLVATCLLISAIASFAAIVTAGMDAESGRAQMVVSRPVRREGVFLGQFLGLGAGVAAYAALFYLAILLTFGFTRGVWPTGWWIGLPVFTLAPLIQLALTLWLSARSGPVGAGFGALLLLLFTWLGNLLELAGHAMRLPKLELAGVMLSLLLPGASMNGWVTGFLRRGIGEEGFIQLQMGSDPSGWMLLYGLLYLAGILLAGMAAYRRREF